MIKKAFTLAEILITLAIIGILAAITIPSLMQSTQDAELKVAWKKTYSEINNATIQLVQDNGGSIEGLFTTHNSLRDLYKPYLKYQKTCNSGSIEGNCWSNLGEFWSLDNTIITSTEFGPNGTGGMILNNGVFVLYAQNSSNCDESAWSITRCGFITVDVNGLKKPNKFGKDMFRIHLLKDKIKPYGFKDDTVKNKCEGSTGANSGLSCAAEYLYN